MRVSRSISSGAGTLLLAFSSAVLLGCSDSGSPIENEDPSGVTVVVANNVFNPATAEVPVNGTVGWQWNSAGVEHNVTFEDGPASQTQGSGTFQRTFATAGSYPYECTIHSASGMVGTVNVTAATGGTGGTGGGGDTGGGDGYGNPGDNSP